MYGKVVTGGIIIFWLAMMGWMAKREILPRFDEERETASAPAYRQVEEMALRPRTERMGIYMGARRIGQSVTSVKKQGPDGLTLVRNRTQAGFGGGTILPFLPPSIGMEVTLDFIARVREGRLLDFDLTVKAGRGEPILAVNGLAAGNQLNLTINQLGNIQTKTVPFDPRQILSSDLTPAVTPEQLRVGQTWPVRTMDLRTMAVRKATARVLRAEQVEIAGQKREAFVVEIPYGERPGEVFTAWVSPEGEVLMQKFLAFRFEREQPAQEEETSSE